MEITEEMVIELNNELAVMGCSFRYKYKDEKIEITLPNMNYVNSYIINVTDDFHEWLQRWFEAKGIELSCNNTGSTLWSKKQFE